MRQRANVPIFYFFIFYYLFLAELCPVLLLSSIIIWANIKTKQNKTKTRFQSYSLLMEGKANCLEQTDNNFRICDYHTTFIESQTKEFQKANLSLYTNKPAGNIWWNNILREKYKRMSKSWADLDLMKRTILLLSSFFYLVF